MCQFFRVDPVVLVLAAMNGFDIQGMGQHELNSLCLTRIGKPIPVEGTFTSDSQVMPVWGYLLQEIAEIVALDVCVNQFVAFGIHKAHVHLS